MNGFEQLFAAWLAFMAAQVDLVGSTPGGGRIALNPPAEVAEIARVEREIGHALPTDLRTLYRIADGQPRLEGEPRYPEDAPVFAVSRRFLSLEGALEERRRALASDGEGRFDPDWYPIASDGKGGGVAIDLLTDASTARGRVYGYGSAETDFGEIDYTLRGWLQKMLDRGDKLSLYRDSEDPLLRDLRGHYHAQGSTPNHQIERSMEYVLEPWLLLGLPGPSRYRTERYLVGIALHVAVHVHCRFQVEATLEGVRIANDWLHRRNLITERRHRHAEAIRVNRHGARTDVLVDYTFESGENGTCGIRSKDGKSSIRLIRPPR